MSKTGQMNEILKLNKANDLAPSAAQRLWVALHITLAVVQVHVWETEDTDGKA